MAEIQFFEKPGCINNTRQKSWLTAAGHRVEEINLLTHAWSKDSLKVFFGDKPIADCFNTTAPVIKSGEMDPASFSYEEGLDAMVREPILIKRPLMVIDKTHYLQGFDKEKLRDLIGLAPVAGTEDLVSELESIDLTICPRLDTGTTCDEEAEKAEELNPLGDVVELVQKMGLDVTYAYEDLVFIEHNAFLFQFDQDRVLLLYFNEDCPEEDAGRIEQRIVALGSQGNLVVKRKGRYSMTQIEEDSNLEIRFMEDEA